MTKRQFIEEIKKQIDKACYLYDGELRQLLNEGKITTGSYYYILNPHRDINYANFYGFEFAGEKRVAMLLKPKNYRLYHFELCLKGIKSLIRQIECVIKLQEHDLKACKEVA